MPLLLNLFWVKEMKGKRPTVSVVMSVYNGRQYLDEAVQSVLSQTFSDFEFIIIDDCSSDGSLELLLEIASKDSRIKLISNEVNLGLTKSLNKAIGYAEGMFIARMDADDICFPTRLERQVECFYRYSDIDIIYCDTVYIDKDSNVICKSWRPKKVDIVLSCLESHNFIPHPTVMFKKSTFSLLGGYNEECRTGQDLELWLRMKDEGLNFFYLNQTLLKYRLNPSSVRSYLSDYWFSVANYCIWNGHRFKVFKYLSRLSNKQKCTLAIKFSLPFYYFTRRFK